MDDYSRFKRLVRRDNIASVIFVFFVFGLLVWGS